MAGGDINIFSEYSIPFNSCNDLVSKESCVNMTLYLDQSSIPHHLHLETISAMKCQNIVRLFIHFLTAISSSKYFLQ